ncbi:adrenodoxin-like [Phascolarctos cinereus]|uniref:Adrenodoxin-like n=1 Tax=Phascolarctos cinereus TaxID=38626 RepID=A0A6P5ILD8_PHACI|nr:adrenodoxin-like [Phascolarctos cinereus]
MMPKLARGLTQVLSSSLVRCLSTMVWLLPTKVQPWRMFGTTRLLQDEIQDSGPQEQLTVNLINHLGKKITVPVREGENMLQLVLKHNLNFLGFGICEGTLTCSTCHLILEKEVFQKLGPISEEELDILDLTCGVTATSRLACQLCMTKAMDKQTLWVPMETDTSGSK